MADKPKFPKNSIESSNFTDGLGSLQEKLPKEDGLFFSRLNWKKKENSDNSLNADDGLKRNPFFSFNFRST